MTDQNDAAMDKNGIENGTGNGKVGGERAKEETTKTEHEAKRRDRDSKGAAESTTSKATTHKSPKKRRKVNHGTQKPCFYPDNSTPLWYSRSLWAPTRVMMRFDVSRSTQHELQPRTAYISQSGIPRIASGSRGGGAKRGNIPEINQYEYGIRLTNAARMLVCLQPAYIADDL